ncbi:F-box/LRR-repeat protein At4g14103-like [Cornus florida]|uniref:F-box/LRR-repeat protein At4g14103-like n=1 Tax=Cornus florida TaxID=4283 RepID=UPI0028989226|nr:F-box/LRR-repeat protein At4g14103-like [Cornus florida]
MDPIYELSNDLERVKMEENEDRISNLPISLIEDILSSLPAKYAVSTSVLSTKWKYLWTSITNLDFDDHDTRMRMRHHETSFINFVNRVLMRNVLDLQKFSLRCTRNYDDVSHLHAWISTALSRNVRELHIFYHMKANNGLPRELYTCTSLVFLELSGGIVVNFPTLGCLPSLKILHIYSIQFVDDDSIYRLFSSCPLLEELFITSNGWKYYISVFNISAPALKKLRYKHFSVGMYRAHKLVLNTPNLQDLEYTDNVAEDYPVNTLHALVNADINLNTTHNYVPGRSVEVLVAEFLQAISEVQCPGLFGDSMKIFQSCSVTLPKFEHLTHSELAVSHGVEWKFVLDFLESLPQLECLDIFWVKHYLSGLIHSMESCHA